MHGFSFKYLFDFAFLDGLGQLQLVDLFLEDSDLNDILLLVVRYIRVTYLHLAY